MIPSLRKPPKNIVSAGARGRVTRKFSNFSLSKKIHLECIKPRQIKKRLVIQFDKWRNCTKAILCSPLPIIRDLSGTHYFDLAILFLSFIILFLSLIFFQPKQLLRKSGCINDQKCEHLLFLFIYFWSMWDLKGI